MTVSSQNFDGSASIRCFVVDDHPLVVEGIRSRLILRSGDISFIGHAGNIEDAVEKIRSGKPDIILLDHQIGERTGLELMDLLMPDFPASRFILLSQIDDRAVLRKYLKRGVRGLIAKVDSGDEFFAAIFQRNILSAVISPFYESLLATPDLADVLTPRENEVVRLVAQGKSNKEIGIELNCSEFTVKTHKASVMRKLNISTSVEMSVWALKNGLL